MGFNLSSSQCRTQSSNQRDTTVLDRTDLREYARRATLTVIALVLILVTHACAVVLAQTTAAAQGQQPPVHHSFTEVATGKALPSRGALQASFHSYKSEDGIVVQLREWYKSASDARSGLDTLTKKASRVIKQGTKKDAKGRIIGKRVELVFSCGHKASPEMVIAWTDGSTVVRLRSTSLPLLLDFENQYYPER
jgi:hypothetical protein